MGGEGAEGEVGMMEGVGGGRGEEHHEYNNKRKSRKVIEAATMGGRGKQAGYGRGKGGKRDVIINICHEQCSILFCFKSVLL